MNRKTLQGKLHIDDQHVGDLTILGWLGAWGFGRFTPNEHFAPVEPIFSEWSRLMHANGDTMTSDISTQLRQLESRMYRLRMRLYINELGQWRQILVLNIDRNMIEWKEGWTRDSSEPAVAKAGANLA